MLDWTAYCLDEGTKDEGRARKSPTSLALALIWKHGRRGRFCVFREEIDKLNLGYMESNRSGGIPEAVGYMVQIS